MSVFPVKTILSEYTFQGCESFLTPFALRSCFMTLFCNNLNTDLKQLIEASIPDTSTGQYICKV